MSAIEITIQRLGPKGDGIARGSRGPVYVERAAPGDRLRARLHRDGPVLRADIVDIVTPSPYRRKPPCAHFDRCGNCSLQHLDLGFYRGWKSKSVREALEKWGIAPQRWLDPVSVGEKSRRRLTFTARKNRGKVVLGYYQRRTQRVTEIETCLVADPKLWAMREPLKPFLGALLKEGQAVDVFLQLVHDQIDMLVTGVVGRLPKIEGVTRLSVRRDERSKPVVVFSKGPMASRFGRLSVSLPPGAFLQSTAAGEAALVKAVSAALPPRGKFADLFSGCGTFTGPMLERGPVDAYESVPWAVQALSKTRAPNLRVFRRDLDRHPLRRDELNRYDAVVFDPPRAGCEEQCAEMAKSRVPTLIAVSCNPATFARDARILHEGAYRLQALQVIDQFLWSHHVEVVGVFARASASRRKRF